MKLKPCPFCGNDVLIFIREAHYPCYSTMGNQVYCNCGASGPVELDEKRAMKSWNNLRYESAVMKMLDKEKIGGVLQLRYFKLMHPEITESDAKIVANVLAQAIVDYWKDYMKGEKI